MNSLDNKIDEASDVRFPFIHWLIKEFCSVVVVGAERSLA